MAYLSPFNVCWFILGAPSWSLFSRAKELCKGKKTLWALFPKNPGPVNNEEWGQFSVRGLSDASVTHSKGFCPPVLLQQHRPHWALPQTSSHNVVQNDFWCLYKFNFISNSFSIWNGYIVTYVQIDKLICYTFKKCFSPSKTVMWNNAWSQTRGSWLLSEGAS